MKNKIDFAITDRVMAAMMGIVMPITLLLSIPIFFKYELVPIEAEPPIILNMMALQVPQQPPVNPVEKPKPKPQSKKIEKQEKKKSPTKPVQEKVLKKTMLAKEEPDSPKRKEIPVEKIIEKIPVEPVLPLPVPMFKITESPQFLHKEELVYPEIMRSSGKTGIVKLAVLIGKEGKVYRITVLKSAGEVFDRAAKKAMMESTFIPAKVGNKNVAVELRMPVTFRLL